MPKKIVDKKLKIFWVFVRGQGIIGFAVGFIPGTSISRVINSLVSDILNPVIGIFLDRFGENSQAFNLKPVIQR